ncbi:hypothetical protein PIROE2DRAFT_62779 [Piromyces sp. E2]|nr:hypothetical protein PIROE2DRAFT_62779 [Piromyces sp. E2]|eukprot:OUM61008.1 hypothetical protein PIROE2DRAFT_62779 [Piromyces sp. E2]
MDMKKSQNSTNTLKAESLQTNYLKIQIEKNFSTGNINRLEDINESSSMDIENDFSFNDDLNSLSSYEAELVNSLNSNINNVQQQLQDQPEIMFSLDDNNSTFLDAPNEDIDNKSLSSIESDLKSNILDEENEAFKPNTQGDTIHYNNIDININNNDNNTINDNEENPINNKHSSITKKNHIIPKELKGITGSYSSLIYNELNKSFNNQKSTDNTLGSTDYLDGYDSSTYSPTSMSSLVNSPHSPRSPNLSKNTSKVSEVPPEKITSPSINLTSSPLAMEEKVSGSKQENNQSSKGKYTYRNLFYFIILIVFVFV